MTYIRQLQNFTSVDREHTVFFAQGFVLDAEGGQYNGLGKENPPRILSRNPRF